MFKSLAAAKDGLRVEVAQEIKTRTIHWGMKNGFMNPLPSKEKSEKAQTVEKILSKMEKAAPYAALMTVLLGEPVEAVSKKVDVAFASGVAVVPLSEERRGG